MCHSLNNQVYLIIPHSAPLQAPSDTDHIWLIIKAEYNCEIHNMSCMKPHEPSKLRQVPPYPLISSTMGRNGSVESLEIKDQNFSVAYIYHHFLV